MGAFDRLHELLRVPGEGTSPSVLRSTSPLRDPRSARGALGACPSCGRGSGFAGLRGLGAAGRPSCLDCTWKHVSSACIISCEVDQGYPQHAGLVVGHLNEAADESARDYPALASEIRKQRLAYMADPRSPQVDLVALQEKVRQLRLSRDAKTPTGMGSIYERALAATPHNVGVGALSSFDEGPLVKIYGIPRATGRSPVNPDIVYVVQIPRGSRGTDATLEKMANMAIEASQDPGFVQEIRGMVRECPPRDYFCEGNTILQETARKIDYLNDPAFAEYLQSPGFTWFIDGRGDCDDQSVFIAAADVSIGRGCRFSAYKLDRSTPDEFSHVLCEMGIRGPHGEVLWYGQDSIVSDPRLGWTPPQNEWLGEPNHLVIVNP